MTPDQKEHLLAYLDQFMDGNGPGVREAHVEAENFLLLALGDAEVEAKWREARDFWWYA